MATGKRSRAAFEDELRAQQSPYVLYGTALPLLDPEVRDDGSYVPVWKQTVTDEHGRKRLHGAFTGGFSAGYFNTVGSKEGWTPSNFVSSRQNRHGAGEGKTSGQRPEDFMDEEDLAEAAEAQQLHTSGSFAGLGSGDGGATDLGLSRQREDTIGVRLLQHMGWRIGQGIGPKIRRKARLDDAADADNNSDEATHLFPPEKSPMILLVKKEDHRGLDLAKDMSKSVVRASESAELAFLQDEDNETTSTLPKSKVKAKQAKPRKGAFGVGVLNDNGSDDEDPYEMGPRVSYNTSISAGKENKMKKLGLRALTMANPRLSAKPTFRSRKDFKGNGEPAGRKCHDRKEPLKGFVLAKTTPGPSSIPKTTQPKIPESWVSSRVSTAANPSSAHGEDTGKLKPPLDASARARVLGETALPGKSVFDFLSKDARSQVAAASGRSDLPPARGEGPPPAFTSQSTGEQPRLSDFIIAPSKDIAEAALGRMSKGWTPYAADMDKSSRYQAFLALCCTAEQRAPTRPNGILHKDWISELREFAHAAQVFKPVTGLMASRFTAASSHQPTGSHVSMAEATMTTPVSISDPAEEAAKAGVFGPLTRSVHTFRPDRLLCKRFGVSIPDLPPEDGVAHDRLQLLNIATAAPDVAKRSGDMEHAKTSMPTELIVNVETNAALEAERAGDDVFRAIFGDCDDEQ